MFRQQSRGHHDPHRFLAYFEVEFDDSSGVRQEEQLWSQDLDVEEPKMQHAALDKFAETRSDFVSCNA